MYAKIFRQIFDGSLREQPAARFTFMDLLVLAEQDGVVDMTHEAIAARTNRPIQEIRETIAFLEAPDPRSRTPADEGRRLHRLNPHRDWGWRIVNYKRFREVASDEQRREMTKNRTRKWRNRRQMQDSDGDACVTHGDAGDAMQRHRQKQRHKAEAHTQQAARAVERCYPEGFPMTPDDALLHKGQCNGDTVFCLKVWEKASGRGGRDAKDVPIRSFPHYLKTEFTYELNRRAEKGMNPNGEKRHIGRNTI